MCQVRHLLARAGYAVEESGTLVSVPRGCRDGVPPSVVVLDGDRLGAQIEQVGAWCRETRVPVVLLATPRCIGSLLGQLDADLAEVVCLPAQPGEILEALRRACDASTRGRAAAWRDGPS
jgi:hypothetical protein